MKDRNVGTEAIYPGGCGWQSAQVRDPGKAQKIEVKVR